MESIGQKQQRRRRLLVIFVIVILVLGAIYALTAVTRRHEAKKLPKKTTVKSSAQGSGDHQ